MVLEADDYVWIVKWHKEYQPDPHPQVGDIYSGLRSPAGAAGGADAETGGSSGREKDVNAPCQYWVKGLPDICSHFSGDTCGVQDGSPTGYNGGKCDYLGRRNWCSHYKGVSGEDADEYMCIAPDMFRTGLGKRDTNVTTHLVLLPYSKSEILGYNEQDGVGRCDGLGMGRGSEGQGQANPEELYKLPVVCRHYKPWIMGFGAVKPRPMGTSVLTGGNIYDGTPSDPLSTLTRHLPFAFRMYNMRAHSQKCAYWDQDFGTDFEMDYSGGYASITLPEDPLTECICTDDACIPYKTIIDEWLPNTSDTLMDVLTSENGVVCNGAKPECPCYTGKWIYCVDDNMRDGMRITVEQILELRFYIAAWQTKEIYDSIFAEKSGPLGLTTSDLYTFDMWEKAGTKVEDSIMKGKRIYQCFPIPLNKMVFDPDIYLTKKSITYPKAKAITGTSGSDSANFPTLVRQIDDYEFIPPLDVIYPYSCKDPWSVEPCDEESGYGSAEVASCNIRPPEVAVFGYTVKEKEIYVLNINKTSFIGDYTRFRKIKVTSLPKNERKYVNEEIKYMIESISEDITLRDYIATGVSNEYGYFNIGPIQLEYNSTNIIAVICMWTPSEYEIVIRDVYAEFYGAYIVQDNFEFKHGSTEEGSGYMNTLPTFFSPAAKLKGHVNSLGGRAHSIIPVHNKYTYGIMQDKVQYSYCVNEYTKKVLVAKWVRIGPTGYIWAEIDNIELSYLFDFEVISASIRYSGDDVDKLICGESGGNIELEVIFPKEDDPDIIKREHILPNCVVLKASEPKGFFNDDWNLIIEYKYKLLESHKAGTGGFAEGSIVWPSDLDGAESIHKFVEPPFSLTQEGIKFTVENISFGNVTVMAYIEDADGRIQAAVAAKMLCDVVTTRCRPVEISYSYKADAVGYDLIPNSGFFTWIGGDKVLSDTYSHYRKALCGDHDCNPDNCKGPMWFPFNNCTTMDFYSWYSGAASCTMPIEGQPRDDWRYCMVDEYKAWVRSGGNWAASCGNGWYYSYSKAGASEFAGFSKIRTSVNLIEYSFMGWTPPPFGNDGREITERWLSQEHYGFWDLAGVEPTPRSEYMPLMFDDEMLFTSFNAFDEKGRIGPIDDYLHTTCVLNYMLSNTINEKITDTRYSFEELFTVINHALCMYPPPVYEGPGGSVTARRYSFKIDDVAWAWREYWKDIERGCGKGSNILNFVDLGRPDYYFDFEKTEHRLITEEGEPTISFVAPKSEAGGFTHPEIFIKGGVPRKFELIYDDYNSEQVDWVEEVAPLGSSLEGGGGEFGGAGATGGWDLEIDGDTGEGEFDTNIYEKAMGDEWFHDVNTIFDVNASAEKSDDRKIVLSKDSVLGDEYAWYNRGLIANIPKNRLIYLPYKSLPATIPTVDPLPDASSEFFAAWYNDSLFSKDIVFSYSDGACITNICLSGRVGIKERSDYYFKGGIYCDPDIVIKECSMDDGPECPGESGVPDTFVYERVGEKGDNYSFNNYDTYGIDADLIRLPKRMLYSSPLLQIRLTIFAGQHLMLQKGAKGGLVELQFSEYIDSEEIIKVWEQRYTTSTGEFGDKNPDGKDSKNLRSFDRNFKNAGQYFPTGINSSEQESVKMCDKMTMVGTSKQYNEDLDLDISIGNLKTIEKEEQQKLYEIAYSKDTYDLLTYSVIIPPAVQQFAAEHDIYTLSSFTGGSLCNFESKKLKWEDHEATISFDQSADFWQPGGHYFKWGSDYYRTSCYIIGPIETIYSPVVVHYKHGEEVIPWSPYEAYVGWSKIDYYEGKLTQAIALEKGIDTGYDWTGPAGGFVMETYQ